MRKSLLLITLLLLAIFPSLVKSQSFGFSGSFVGMFPKYKSVQYTNYYYNNRTIGHTGNFTEGIRLEVNYILPDYSIPVSGFNGFGVTFFLPLIDSAAFEGHLKNNQAMTVLGTSKMTARQYSFRFGYEIPQSFNEFLFLHAGWGMGLMRYKTENIVPERSANFTYDKSDFDETTFTPTKGGSFAFELIAGGIYEFEHFSIMGQYSVTIGFGDEITPNSRYRHGFTAGIYYPLKKF